MHKLSVRLLSAFLTVAILIVSLPLTVFAITNESEVQESSVSDLGSIDSYTYELIDRRDEYTKHFRQADGTVVAVRYAQPVHRLDENGVWQEIDNTLVSSSNEYKTSDARIKFAKKTTGNEVLFTLHDGNSKITMSLDGAAKKIEGEVANYSADEDSDEITKMSHLEKLNSKVVYENILEGVDLEYIVVSNTIKENIILSSKRDSYVFTFTMKLNNMTAELAEDGGIIVYDDSNNEAYVIAPPFMYDDNGNISHDVSYTLAQSSNNEYKITVAADESWIESDGRAFPVTIDPSLSPSDSNVEDLYVNSSYASTSFAASAQLIAGSTHSSYWKNTTLPTLPEYAYITSANFSLTKSSGNVNYIGVYRVTSDWTSSLTYNDTVASSPIGEVSSELIDYQYIVGSASLYTWDITELVKQWYDGTYPNYGICLKNVSGTSVTGLTYFYSNDYPTVSSRPRLMITYKDMFGFEDYWSYISQSAGLAGDGHINLATGALTFNISTLTTTDSLMPFTASLIYNSPLGRFLFTRLNKDLPYSFATTAGGYKTNMNVCIVPRTRVNAAGVSETYYIYTDSDGTEHGFFKSTVSDEDDTYYDDDGLKLKLKVFSDHYEIEDAAYNKYTFTKKDASDSYSYPGGFLQSIQDVNGNQLIIETDVYGKPISIQMTPNGSTTGIVQLNIAYNSDGVISYILNPTSQQAYLFYYSSSNTSSIVTTEYRYLRKIVLAHQTGSTSSSNWNTFYTNGSCSGITVDAECYYDYDSNGKMTSVRDTFHKVELKYEYDSAGRVISVQEFAGANSTAGQKVGLTYGADFTKVRTSGTDDIYGNDDDIYTVYTFDNEGRCVSTYSTDITGQNIYGATSGEYVSDNEKAKNSLKSVSTVSDISTNYLVNSNFEINGESSLLYWSKSGNVSTIPLTFDHQSAEAYNYNYYDSAYNVKIAANAGETSCISQKVYLKKGTYTLSAALTAIQADNVTVKLKVKSLDNTSTVYTEEFNFRKDFALPVDAEETLSFDVNSSTERFEVYLEVIGKSGANSLTNFVKVSHMTLSKSLGYSANNKVNYGSFESSVISSGTNTYPISAFWTSGEGTGGVTTQQVGDISGFALRVVGEGVQNERYISQTIYRASQAEINNYIANTSSIYNTTKQYRVSARGFSESAMPSSGTFGLRVVVTFINSNGTESITDVYIPFNKHIDTWQYVSQTIDIGGAFVSKIEIRCEFNNQTGTAYFDDVSFSYLGTDNSQTTYTYDANGMPRSMASGYSKIWYEYDGTLLLQEVSKRSATLYTYTENTNRIEKVEQYSFEGTEGENWNFNNAANKKLRATTTYTYNNYGQPTIEKTTSSGVGTIVSVKTYNTTAGSHIFGALTSETDSLGRTTRYFYDNNKGYLLATLAPDGNGIVYEYDALGRMTYAAPAKASSNSYTESSSAEGVSYYYDSTGKLYSINNNYNYYDMSYDEFGNMVSVGVSDLNLASYTYNSGNGKLSTMAYGNGDSVKYEYDTLDRIQKICYKESGEAEYVTKYEYKYDSNGYLHTLYDYDSGQTISYKYDASGRLVEYYVNNDASYNEQSTVVNGYDDEGRVEIQNYRRDYKYGDDFYSHSSDAYYAYSDEDGSLEQMLLNAGGFEYITNYSYDNLGRLTDITTYTEQDHNSNLTVWHSYTYATGEFIDDYDNSYYNTLSGQISGVTTRVNGDAESYTYTYNNVGYITHIYRNGTLACSYEYDDLGQLTRENNADTNCTYVYTYDTTGNILSKKVYDYTTAATVSTIPIESHTYYYGKTDWNDLLQGYDNSNFSHDGVGNPLTYNNGSSYTFEWKQGRRLATAQVNGYELEFTYNDEGIRTSKTINGITHYYHLAGSQIISEEWTENGVNHLLVYNYDADGTIMGMSYRNSTYDAEEFDNYLFIKNIQGDVIHIYDENGNKVVSYTYDAWGNITSTTGSMASTIGKMNPFRYRGYYYDEELGFYYLNSRYYDPKIGRFINADGIMAGVNGNFKGYNLFAYCFNDPINMTDDAGDWPSWNDIKSGYKKLKKWVKNNIVTPVKDFANDCKNYEKYNEDVNKVFESKYFSSYKGKLVIRFDESELLSSFGVFDTVFLEHRKYDTNTDDDSVSKKNNLLNHEYGHLLQEDDLGTGKYLLSVALPSVIYNVLSEYVGILDDNYYNMPWEYDADMRGGVNRGYSSWAPGISDGYMSLWR